MNGHPSMHLSLPLSVAGDILKPFLPAHSFEPAPVGVSELG